MREGKIKVLLLIFIVENLENLIYSLNILISIDLLMRRLPRSCNSSFVYFRLMEFVPPNKRTEEHFRSVFEAVGLADIVKLHKAQASQEAKRDLQQLLLDDLAENRPMKDITIDLKEMAQRCVIPEHEVIGLVMVFLLYSQLKRIQVFVEIYYMPPHIYRFGLS